MDRVKLDFVPEWYGSIEGWATNYIVKHLWRVIPEHDMDDLLQDAHMYYLICKKKYPEVNDPAHFMALFKTCLRNHVTELSIRRTKKAQISSMTDRGDMNDVVEEVVDGGIDDADLRVLLEDAKGPLAWLVEQLLMREEPPPFQKNVTRETTIEYLRRLAHVGSEYPIVEKVTAWIKGDEFDADLYKKVG